MQKIRAIAFPFLFSAMIPFMIPFMIASMIFGSSMSLAATSRPKVRVCVGDEYWFPFSYIQDGVMQGVHLDMAKMALNAAGFDAEFVTMPWARCANHETKNGTMDVPLSAGCRKERLEWLYYPADAEVDGPDCKSKYALMCNGHVVVVPAKSKYKFDGDLSKVPQPIRIVHGYVQVKESQDRKVQVDTGSNDESNLRKMLRDETGSVLMLIESGQQFTAMQEFKNKFRIIENYSDSGDSFMPFSKKGKFSEADAKRVWEEIAKLRKYPVLIDNSLRSHQKKSNKSKAHAPAEKPR